MLMMKQNMERAIKFYKETFSWKINELTDFPGYAIFECADVKYALAGNE
jgi:predicted enzyme related to lactoylglutathione lyase